MVNVRLWFFPLWKQLLNVHSWFHSNAIKRRECQKPPNDHIVKTCCDVNVDNSPPRWCMVLVPAHHRNELYLANCSNFPNWHSLPRRADCARNASIRCCSSDWAAQVRGGGAALSHDRYIRSEWNGGTLYWNGIEKIGPDLLCISLSGAQGKPHFSLFSPRARRAFMIRFTLGG